ncbi:MAG: Gfo/Idh/MocA family oxidoreductase [Anaerolineae bacterium]|nr:Gfo/Idh/MocA family oxidoreductase [Anaerolineae bacterium]
MDKIRVGLVGCGQQATWIIHPSVRMIEAYDIVACCDANMAAAQATAARYGIPHAYTDYQAMLSKEQMDAVVIVTTPENHAELTCLALEAGLHVMVEKPPVKTVAEAERVMQVSARTDKHVMVAFMMRFRPFNAQVKRLAAEMAVPPALFQLAVNFGPARSKVSGYPPELYLLLSVGVHYFDLIRFFMGEVTQISAHLHSYSETQVIYAMQLVCERGVTTFNLHSCERLGFSTSEKLGGQVNERYYLVGRGESLFLDNCEQLTWVKPDGTVEFYQPSRLALSFLEGQAYYQGGYYQEMLEFADSLRQGRTPSVTIQDGLRATQLVLAAYASAKRGGEPLNVQTFDYREPGA